MKGNTPPDRIRDAPTIYGSHDIQRRMAKTRIENTSHSLSLWPKYCMPVWVTETFNLLIDLRGFPWHRSTNILYTSDDMWVCAASVRHFFLSPICYASLNCRSYPCMKRITKSKGKRSDSGACVIQRNLWSFSHDGLTPFFKTGPSAAIHIVSCAERR